MYWKDNSITKNAASEFCAISRYKIPAKQYPGYDFSPRNWQTWVLQPSQWSSAKLKSSPDEIIYQLSNHRYTQALALVVAWGGMQRTKAKIIGSNSLSEIEAILRSCSHDITSSRSIKIAWEKLTSELGWTDVIKSKTLHFLCRSLGFNKNPPVAIDTAIIKKQLWPLWKNKTAISASWTDDNFSFEAYIRYMTVIRTWARLKGWTTTDVEATIFHKFSNKLRSDKL